MHCIVNLLCSWTWSNFSLCLSYTLPISYNSIRLKKSVTIYRTLQLVSLMITVVPASWALQSSEVEPGSQTQTTRLLLTNETPMSTSVSACVKSTDMSQDRRMNMMREMRPPKTAACSRKKASNRWCVRNNRRMVIRSNVIPICVHRALNSLSLGLIACYGTYVSLDNTSFICNYP